MLHETVLCYVMGEERGWGSSLFLVAASPLTGLGTGNSQCTNIN